MSNRTIGATLALDGEAKFKSAITSATTALKAMKSEMNLTKEQFSGSANTIEALTAKHKALEKVLEASQKKQEATASALAHSRQDYERITTELAKYEQELGEASAALDAMKKSGTASDAEIAEQEKKVAELSAAVEQGTESYQKAGDRVATWETKMNSAQTETIKMGNALKENDRYLEEAKNSTDGVATSIDEYGKKSKSATADASKFGETVSKGMDEASGSIKTFGSSVGQFFTVDKLSEYADKISDAVKSIGDAAYSSALELDEGYDTIISKTGATGTAMATFKEQANDIFGSMPVTMKDVGTALGEVNTRFKVNGDQLSDLTKMYLEFAQINDTDVNSAIDSTQKALAAFGATAEDAPGLLDAMTAAGQNTGISMDKLSDQLVSNAATLQEMGLGMSQSVEFLGQLELSGANSSDVLRGLKTAMKNATDQGIPLSTALQSMQSAISDSTDGVDGLKTAYETFGSKAAPAVYNAVKNGSLSFDTLAQSAASYTGTVSKTFDETQDSWDTWTTTMNRVKTAGSDLARNALSTLEPAMSKVGDVIEDLTDAFDGMSDGQKKAVGLLTAGAVVLGTVGPKAAAFAQTISAISAARAMSAAAAAAHTTATEAEAAATGEAAAAQSVLNAVMDANPVLLLVTGIATLAAGTLALSEALSVTGDSMGTLNDDMKAQIESAQAATDALQADGDAIRDSFSAADQSISDAASSADLAASLADELATLNSTSDRTVEQQQRMAAIVAELNSIYPSLNLAIDDQTGNLNATNAEMMTYIDNLGNMAKAQAYYDAFKDVVEELADAQRDAIEAQYEQKKAQDAAAESTQDYADAQEAYAAAQQKADEAQSKYLDLASDASASDAERAAALDDYNEAQAAATEAQEEMNALMYESADAQKAATEAADDYNEASESTGAAIEDAQEKSAYYQDQLESMGYTLSDFADGQLAAGDAAEQGADKITGAAESVGESADELEKKYNELKKSAEDSLSSQVKAFDELDGSAASIDDVKSALESQITVLNAYSDNMNTLQASTADMDAGTAAAMQSFIQNVADMGTDGAQYAQMMVDALAAGDGSAEALLADFGGAQEAKANWAENLAGMTSDVQGAKTDMEAALADNSGVADAMQGLGEGADSKLKAQTSQWGKTAGVGIKNVTDKMTAGKGAADTAAYVMGNAFNTGLSNTASGAGSAAQSIVNAAKAPLKNTTDAFTWGSDFTSQYASGLRSQIGSVSSAAEAIASAVAGPTHHSTPDYGPLAGDDKWGSEFGMNFVNGLLGTVGAAKIASNRFAEAVAFDTDDFDMGSVDVSTSSHSSDLLAEYLPRILSAAESGGLDANAIYTAVRTGASDATPRTYLNGREVSRTLKNMGVAFNG